MVAISPETPDSSLTLVQKHNLNFEVLSDPNNSLARKFGIVYEVSGDLASLYEQYGIDLKTRNQTEKAELPLAATYVIDANGIIRYAYLEVDYTKRAEPDDLLKAIGAI